MDWVLDPSKITSPKNDPDTIAWTWNGKKVKKIPRNFLIFPLPLHTPVGPEAYRKPMIE